METPEAIESRLRANMATGLPVSVNRQLTVYPPGSPEYEAYIAKAVLSTLTRQEQQAERDIVGEERRKARVALSALEEDLDLLTGPNPLTQEQFRTILTHLTRVSIHLIRGLT
jgi:molybdopterin-biosynthesis enzyme MoeA-like protein